MAKIFKLCDVNKIKALLRLAVCDLKIKSTRKIIL